MTAAPLRVLLVEDDPDDYVLTRDLLTEMERLEVRLDWAPTYDAALDALGRERFDVVLSDYRLGERTGLELLRDVVAAPEPTPFILLTGQGDREVDLRAMEMGAADYLIKGETTGAMLERAIRYARERQRLLEVVRAHSLTDELTGLYNRRGFLALSEPQRRLAERKNRGMLLLFIDLDGMKELNDRHGHLVGDWALRETATLLRDTFRETDVLARIGGDEFVVLVLETGAPEADGLRRRLDQNLSRFNANGAFPHRLSLSAGMAVYHPGDDEPLESLLDRADRAMYRDKQDRRVLRAS